jgi:dTDP-4-dehydrorhamnose reductase
MVRYLVTGATGMLGTELVAALAGRTSRGDITAASRSQLDITDAEAVDAAVAGHDVVINCAAWTAVDAAEDHEDDARQVNALGPELLARAANRHGAVLVTISTDYVFNGQGIRPYPEDTPRDPVSAYGRTKAEGEERAIAANPGGTIVVRTAWLYGEHGPNFAETVLRLAGERETLRVVDDQVGQPTWTRDLADKIVELLDAGVRSGIFHGTNGGRTSWWGFARAIFSEAGLDPRRVLPTDSSTYPQRATRPAYSVLGHDGWASVGLAPMRNWADALADASANGVFGPG